MAADETHADRGGAPSDSVARGELIDRLVRFDGPMEQFLANLLATQCHLAGASGAAILRPGQGDQAQVLALHPPPDSPGQPAPAWLSQAVAAAREVAASGLTVVRSLRGTDDMYGQPARRNLVLLPVKSGVGTGGVAVYMLETRDAAALSAGLERLELTISLLSLHEMRLTLQARGGDMRHLRLAMGVLAAMNEQKRFAGAAMSLCNELASRWQCDRVTLGFLKGRYVQTKALSHTEKFSRKMQLVQDIESAMEECIDQDVEIVYPPASDATSVSRAAGELSTRQGPTCVVSLPLRKGGEPVAVVTAERAADQPFTLGEIESLRLTCDLCAARVIDLHEHDRWFGARAAGAVHNGLALVVGAKHTWIKLAAVLVMAAIVFLTFAHGDYRADASFKFQAERRQVVSAPFDGFLTHAYVQPDQARVVIGSAGGEPSWLLKAEHVSDWSGLLDRIDAQAHAEAPSPGKQIWAMLDPSIREKIAALAPPAPEPPAIEPVPAEDVSEPPAQGAATAPATQPAETRPVEVQPVVVAKPAPPTKHFAEPDEQTKADLLQALNGLLSSEQLYDQAAWSGLELSQRQHDLLDLRSQLPLAGGRLVELNRSLLVTAFAGQIAPGPTVLAVLDTSERRVALAEPKAELLAALKRADASMRDGKTAEAQIARAEADKLTAQIRLMEYRIAQARLVSPITGQVIAGDLKRRIGVPVKTGDLLFEVAPLESLRAELSVPEDEIAAVIEKSKEARKEGKRLRGRLAAVGKPDQRIGFTVERIEPVAEVVDQRNVFRVRVILDETRPWMSPGMEGVAKIHLGREPYVWLWTRTLLNWFRMKFWL